LQCFVLIAENAIRKALNFLVPERSFVGVETEALIFGYFCIKGKVEERNKEIRIKLL
jgi:hypothetical protein